MISMQDILPIRWKNLCIFIKSIVWYNKSQKYQQKLLMLSNMNVDAYIARLKDFNIRNNLANSLEK